MSRFLNRSTWEVRAWMHCPSTEGALKALQNHADGILGFNNRNLRFQNGPKWLTVGLQEDLLRLRQKHGKNFTKKKDHECRCLLKMVEISVLNKQYIRVYQKGTRNCCSGTAMVTQRFTRESPGANIFKELPSFNKNKGLKTENTEKRKNIRLMVQKSCTSWGW